MSDEAREAVDENQKLAESEEKITKPAPKEKPQREKDPKKVAAGKKLAEKNRQAKAALDHEVKREREMAEKEQENENSPGWLPEMSFQTVLSIVGIVPTSRAPRSADERSGEERCADERSAVSSKIGMV